ncbi:guanylate kinase [Peptostreptococcus equinus]|uniref:Guanylate kinase n=1 Tax=Peptostreptococcus equinus TaxID=3003601 RepID=A0ABY7JM54_9FIRM|nr:guanylate kinase [Peptostreptococcus sp. CBA3647]WAW14239.1 guanylate kinase [Peptostreptococcus sp. CBA3647]
MLKKRGLLLVVSGPSGAGKGTVCKKVIENNDNIMLSVSATTRQPRTGEVEGISYYYKTKEQFEHMIENGQLLEYARVYDNYYGTPKQEIYDQLENGTDIILEIEMQGAMQVKKKFPQAVFIFILPPSLNELKNRIVGRGTETIDQIEKRMSSAFGEIKLIKDYDYFIFNDSIEKSADQVMSIVNAERSKVIRYKEEIISIFKKEI